MLNDFIYAKTKDLFLKELEAGNVLDEAIVFIEDTKEIWNHGTYFAGNAFNINYSDLVALRNNNQLVPGSFYRITDYVTTTTQSKTKSANHPFDVIVLALGENTLCEDAKAILHEGDTYFADSDLSSWELKYCLDNDKTKFEWADETNGKGVIYRMIDEKRNDCPYDFKNILFYNNKFTSYITSDKYYYTFSYLVSGVLYDGTTEKQTKFCYGNMMGEYYNMSGMSQLNKNVFRNTSFYDNCHSNKFGYNCYSNTFGDSCHSNKFGYNCYSNTFGDSCYSNTFGDSCYSNTFGDSCYSNKFGNYSHSNTFGNYLQNRSLDSDKTSITLNDEFYDDGSGQLVPTKHPDLSTQPSILPYKFMGQYVYEQLIPVNKGDRVVNNEFAVETPMIISAEMFGTNSFKNVNILATKSNALLLDTLSELSGYINVKYTDGSILSSSGGGGYYYGSTSTSSSNNPSIDFGIIADGTLYIYDNDNDILTLSKNGEIDTNSIPTQYKNSSKIIIDNNVTSIGSSAFSVCTSLASITIPDGVTSIGFRAFFGCSSLTSVTIPNSVTSIGNYAFYNCTGLTSVTIPNSVTSIGTNTFYGCSSLTSVTIPNSVTSIGTNTFYGCSSLTSVTIPDSVTYIYDSAFYNCSGLTSVVIPDSVTYIYDSAFYNCSGLTSVVIPDSVTYIGNSAFYNCSGLTSVVIGSGVTKILEYAFAGCSGLTSMAFKSKYPPGIYMKNRFEGIDPSIPIYVPAESLEMYKSSQGLPPFTNFQAINEL